MISKECAYQKGYHAVIGAVLALLGLLFAGLGVTVMPVIGLLLAIPTWIIAGYFFMGPGIKACEIGT